MAKFCIGFQIAVGIDDDLAALGFELTTNVFDHWSAMKRNPSFVLAPHSSGLPTCKDDSGGIY